MRTYEITTNDPKIQEVLEKFVVDCNRAIAQVVIPKNLSIDRAMFSIMVSKPNPDSNRFRIHVITPPIPTGFSWMVFGKVKKNIKKYLEGNGIKDFEVKEIKGEDVVK